MKHFLKKVLKGISVIALCISMNVNYADAAPKAQIYADKVEIKAEDNAKVPVRIKNNPGIMGYVITVECDSEKLELVGISAGNLSENGVFDHNLLREKKGTVEILWSYTKEVREDGVLFYLDIRAKKKIEKITLQLRYSPEDTFNEKYESVEVTCCPITIKGGDHTVVTSTVLSDEKGIGSNKKEEESIRMNHHDFKEQEETERIQSGQQEEKKSEEQTTEKKAKIKEEETDGKRESPSIKETPEVIGDQSIKVEDAVRKSTKEKIGGNETVSKETNRKKWIFVGIGVLLVGGIVTVWIRRRLK